MTKLLVRILASSVIASSLLISGCESEDLDNANLAQECLNKISDANYADATSCRSYVDGVDTEAAKTILCSIDLFSGGITTTRMVNAFEALDEDAGGGSKEAIFMTALSMSSTSAADQALASCTASGLSGMIFIASMAKMGTALANLPGGIALPTPGNEGAYTPPSEADVDAALAACDADPTGCATDIGEAVTAVNDTYCSGSNSDSDICTDIAAAIANTDGSAQAVGQYLLGLLDD